MSERQNKGKKEKNKMSNDDGTPALMISDLVTMLTAMLEQKMYTNRADPMPAFRFSLVVLVSRIVEKILANNVSGDYYGKSRQSKNRIVVFIMYPG